MKTYKELVEEAKGYLEKIDSYQYKVASMALQACQIRHGGKSTHIYTMADFARDTGMKAKTLSAWVTIYRDVLLPVGKPAPTKEEWKHGARTANLLKTQRSVDNRANGKVGTRDAYKKEVPVQKVKELFNKISSGENNIGKFERVYSSSGYNNSLLKDIRLSDIPDGKLIRLMEWLDQSSDIINDHLTSMRKKDKQTHPRVH